MLFFLENQKKSSFVICWKAYWYVICMQNTYIHPWVSAMLCLLKNCLFQKWLIQTSMIFPRNYHVNRFFQEIFMLTNFENFSLFSMILKQIWISVIFQELWEPCWRKLSQDGSTLLSCIIIFIQFLTKFKTLVIFPTELIWQSLSERWSSLSWSLSDRAWRACIISFWWFKWLIYSYPSGLLHWH